MLAKVANKWVTPSAGDGSAGSIKDFKPRDVIRNKRKSMKERMRGEDGLLRKAKNAAKDTIKSKFRDMKDEIKDNGFAGLTNMFQGGRNDEL